MQLSELKALLRRPDLSSLLAWIAICVYLVGLAIAASLRSQGDFAIYYTAGNRFLHNMDLYPPTDGSKFLYAPIFAAIISPLSLLSRPVAQFVFFLPNGAALVALICGAARILFGKTKSLPASFILLPTVFCARFINNNVEHGQVDLLVLALTVWSIAFGQDGSNLRAGALLSFALLSKPLALSAVIYFLAMKKYQVLACAFLFLGFLLLLPIVFTGVTHWVQLNQHYLQAVASMGSRYRETTINQSVSAILFRILTLWCKDKAEINRLADWAGYVYFFGAVLGIYLWLKSTRRWSIASWQHRLAIGGLFAITPSFTSVAWKHYFVALMVPYMALLPILSGRSSSDRFLLLIRVLVFASVTINFAMIDSLNHIVLQYGGHLLSSFLVLTALVLCSKRLAEEHVDSTSELSALRTV